MSIDFPPKNEEDVIKMIQYLEIANQTPEDARKKRMEYKPVTPECPYCAKKMELDNNDQCIHCGAATESDMTRSMLGIF